MNIEAEQKLPEGWELLRFPSTVEIRNEKGDLVHVEPVPYGGVTEWDLKHGVIRRALDPCLRSSEAPQMNAWQLHFRR